MLSNTVFWGKLGQNFDTQLRLSKLKCMQDFWVRETSLKTVAWKAEKGVYGTARNLGKIRCDKLEWNWLWLMSRDSLSYG
jgi:hypothetical protein